MFKAVLPGLSRPSAGAPAALSRLSSEITETVEAIWQRALALTAQAATNDDNAARERFAQVRV